MLFICPNCGNNMKLPFCECGHIIQGENSIYQLSVMPDIRIEGEGDQYIGYEFIGESYSGNRKYIIEERDAVVAKEIAVQTNKGVFLDLACGDGCFTVPCAAFGIKIIAGDISNKMLSILKQKAKYNNISLENVTLCRMNALEVPLIDNSIDVAVANSVLHLISNPKKVISEIYRILKSGGKFICIDDRPGRSLDNSFDNTKYNEIVNYLYNGYWNKLRTSNFQPKKYRWKFDRTRECDKLFKSKSEKLFKGENIYEVSLKEGFLPRFIGQGFSDQVDVPKDIHNEVITELLDEAKNIYGNDYDEVSYKSIEEDLLLSIFIK